MASANARDQLIVPGRLVKSPTNLSAAYPYGGTELGLARDHVFRPNMRTRPVVAEEFADQVVEMDYRAQNAVLGVILSSWDLDGLSAVLPNASAGASGRVLVSEDVNRTTGTRPGVGLSSRAVALLFVPDALRVNPAILFYKAVPYLSPDALLRLQRNVHGGLAAIWQALPDDNGRTYQAGALEDLTL